MKHAVVPEIKALNATDAISPFLCGAIEVRAAIMIPTEPRLAKPQRAYVVITSERACKQFKKMRKIIIISSGCYQTGIIFGP